eukprot:12906605-Prorocentrum_lima.AAC.1
MDMDSVGMDGRGSQERYMKDVERNMGEGIRFVVDLNENAGLVSLAQMIQRNQNWVRHADTVWVCSLGSGCG